MVQVRFSPRLSYLLNRFLLVAGVGFLNYSTI
nr:MAG TPA: hypothetical protein [Bacteriophage sp.]